jgi:hypothetical protein
MRHGAPAGFQNAPIAWWGIMVIDAYLLVSVALVTLPMYAVTLHTRCANEGLLQELAGVGDGCNSSVDVLLGTVH